MVSRRIAAVHMHYLLLQSLLNTLQDLRYTVDFWMQAKLSTWSMNLGVALASNDNN